MTMECNGSGNIAMLPVKGFGVAVDTDYLPKTDLTPLEDRLSSLEDNLSSSVESLKKELEEALSLARTKATYQLCEFYSFRNPQKKKGFELAHGDLLENASALYPEAWAFLQTDEGKALCVTEDEWQALTHAVYYTATSKDGAGKDVIQEFSFDGIGGAPFYVQNIEAGTLRLPDIRGMYAEASGFDGLTVGGVHGDMMRNIAGDLNSHASNYGFLQNLNVSGITGVFFQNDNTFSHGSSSNWDKHRGYGLSFDSSRTIPTGNANKPRAFGVLPCVYLGNSK